MAAVDAAGGPLQPGEDDDDAVVAAERRSGSLSRSPQRSSEDLESRLSGDDRSRTSLSVRFAAVSILHNNNHS